MDFPNKSENVFCVRFHWWKHIFFLHRLWRRRWCCCCLFCATFWNFASSCCLNFVAQNANHVCEMRSNDSDQTHNNVKYKNVRRLKKAIDDIEATNCIEIGCRWRKRHNKTYNLLASKTVFLFLSIGKLLLAHVHNVNGFDRNKIEIILRINKYQPSNEYNCRITLSL